MKYNNELEKNRKKIKIIFYINSFRNFGGAERVLTILLQHLDRSKFDIFLLMAEKKGSYLSEIPTDVKIIDLDLPRTVLAIPKIALTLRRIEPDIFFCIRNLVLGFSLKLFKFFSPSTKFIMREVIIPSVHNQLTESFSVFFSVGYKIIYPWFDRIVCQSDDMKNDLIDNYKISREKLVKIHNPVDVKKIERHIESTISCENNDQINLLAIGRLTHQKGFDILIDAFALLDDRFYLTILGKGEQRDYLEKKISDLNLTNRIDLVGFVENPYVYMLKSDIFVLPSRYEGLPNILLEVMLCGIPVVAFKCLGGINEIIIPKKNGFVVPNGDVKMLSEYILLATKTKFEKEKIKNFVKQKFSCKERVRDYEQLFSDIISEP